MTKTTMQKRIDALKARRAPKTPRLRITLRPIECTPEGCIDPETGLPPEPGRLVIRLNETGADEEGDA